MRKDADIQIQGGVYRSAIIAAAANGKLEMLRLILEVGPIETSNDDNRLLLAALRGDLEEARQVLGKE